MSFTTGNGGAAAHDHLPFKSGGNCRLFIRGCMRREPSYQTLEKLPVAPHPASASPLQALGYSSVCSPLYTCTIAGGYWQKIKVGEIQQSAVVCSLITQHAKDLKHVAAVKA